MRVATAVVVVALAAATMAVSAMLIAFGLAEMAADRARLAAFVDDPMIGALARARLLALSRDEADGARGERLGLLLAATPLSGGAWLELSRARLESGEEPDKVVSALAMSSLVGPNEAWLMGRRAAFGVTLWAGLPPAARRSLVADLVGGWEALPGVERDTLIGLLSLAPPEAREETRLALLRAGPAAAPLVAILGLARPSEDAARP